MSVHTIRTNDMLANKLGGQQMLSAWTPQTEINAYGGMWFDQNDLTDGTVSNFTSRDGRTTVVSTGTAPTKSASGIAFGGSGALTLGVQRASFVSRTPVPDGLGMPPGSTGKGVTCTGLCRIPNTTQFWMANHGDTSAGRDGSGPYVPSLIRFDYTNRVITKLQEIDLSLLLPGIKSIQGVTFDTSDNTLWFASTNAAGMLNVYHVTQSGGLLSDTITPSWAPNGVAYVPGEDAMWISENPTINNNIEKRSCATGAVILAAATTSLSDQDMLAYDSTVTELLLSYGTNGTPGNLRVYALTGASGAFVDVGRIQLDIHADAVEGGVVREGGKIYVTSDSYYHNGTDGVNQLIEYDVVPPMANVVSVHLTASVSAATSDCFLEIGGGTDGPLDGFGIGIYPITTTTLTIAANTFTSGSTQRGLINAATVPAMTSMRLIDVLFDVPNDLVTLYVDGTLITTGSLAALSGGISLAGAIFIGTGIKAAGARHITGTIRDVMVMAGATDRQRMEGYRAHRWGLIGNLPAGHPYKNAAPI